MQPTSAGVGFEYILKAALDASLRTFQEQRNINEGSNPPGGKKDKDSEFIDVSFSDANGLDVSSFFDVTPGTSSECVIDFDQLDDTYVTGATYHQFWEKYKEAVAQGSSISEASRPTKATELILEFARDNFMSKKIDVPAATSRLCRT